LAKRIYKALERLLGNELFIITLLIVNFVLFAVGYLLDNIDIMILSTASLTLVLFSAAYQDSLNDDV
jgi:hypothetical protein